jgi:hypothetical protein
MHVHVPKPLHGWRAFLGEVGIIVLGVLIALGAEQVVETLHWQNEAREFRAAIDHELALNLGTFEFYELQRRCVSRRLDELQTFLDRSADNQTMHLAGPIGAPMQLSQYTSVWDNKDARVVAHLPMQARLKYAQLYDEFHNTNGVKQALSSAWAKLVPFEVPGPLTLEDRRQLHALIKAARADDITMASNWPVAQKLATPLGIKAEYPPEAPNLAEQIPTFPICKPILKN